MLAAVLLGLPARAVAQAVSLAVTGTVRVAEDSAPIPGAVVMLLDSTGQVAHRTLTDRAGHFRLEAETTGTRVRVLHIGFAPVEASVHPGEHLDLLMHPLAVQLGPVRTIAQGYAGEFVCGDAIERDTAVYTLWEQARAALLGNVVAREVEPGTFRMVKYTRSFLPRRPVLVRQETQRLSGAGLRPFAAVNAETIAKQGYVYLTDGWRLEFLAPDAEVLLSAAFISDHCFGITVDSAEHPGAIGLAFRPEARVFRSPHADVQGTLWMHRMPVWLDTLAFAYTSLPTDMGRFGGSGGGWLAFTTMPTGVPMITRWLLIMPSNAGIFGWTTEKNGKADTISLAEGPRHVNGVLTEAQWPDGSAWHDSLATMAGWVTEGVDGPPVTGLPVWSEWLPDTVVTDAQGRFEVHEVPPGPYRIHTADPVLTAFHVESLSTDVVNVWRDSVAPIHLVVPADTTVARIACGPSQSESTAVAFVQLGTLTAPPKHDLILDAVWAKPIGTGPDSLAALPFGREHRKVKEREQGHVILCGVPRGGALHIRVTQGKALVADTIFHMDLRRPLSYVQLSLRDRTTTPDSLP